MGYHGGVIWIPPDRVLLCVLCACRLTTFRWRQIMIHHNAKFRVGLGIYVLILCVHFELVSCFTKQRSARLDGQIILGALFPVHLQPPSATAYSRTCGDIREHYGIQRVETFLLTLDKINADKDILRGIKLGCDIRDSCWYSAIALEQSINFIKDAIASKTQLSRDNQSSSCEGEHRQPIAGLIGPGSSEATIQVQNLLQIFNIPQIGYSATSMDLSKRADYKYFLRVVPPDNYQAQALVDIVLHYNWTYISTVHTDGNYGVRGMEKFSDLARSNGICIASSDNVASSSGPGDFDKVIDTLLNTPNASVVVCFCEGLTVKSLLKATARRGVSGKFLIIGSDGWGNRLDVVEGIEHLAAGGISIKLYSPRIPDFDDHYASLRHNNNPRNPWFQEFWQERFKCYLAGEDRDLRYNTSCTGNETLVGAEQDSKLGFVVSAVYTLAYALDRMHQAVCGNGTVGLCEEMIPINGSDLLQHIHNVTFTSYSNDTVYFDENGNPPGRYDILNYQPVYDDNGNRTYNYVTIGSWSSGSLDMRDEQVFWPGTDSQIQVSSVCSLPCPRGSVKHVKGVACCWVCTPCLENEIVRDNVTCDPCPLGFRPNTDLSDCEMIPIEFISWSSTEAVVSMVLACIGIVVTMWVFYVFLRHNDTPVVKASTRELSYIILLGTVLAYCCNFVMVAKPSIASCYLSRILPGLAFSLIYGALVTKTNRIARILEGSKRILTKKPRFMSASAQVVITGIVIGVECAVITGMLILEPADSQLDYPTMKRVRLVCNTSTLGVIVPLGFDVFLIFMCTLYAIKTRNLPENFNEAKFIGFTMYTTCVIWLGFFPIYFGGESKVVTMCISITLSASVSLVLLFFPKVYVIVWSPERNTRGAFTTSRDVRCHIGSKSLPSCDSVDQKEKKYEGLFKSDIGRPPGSRDGWGQQGDKGGTIKRSSFPQSQASPQHKWFCSQRPSHIAEMQQSRRRCSPGSSNFRKQMSEDLDMMRLPPLDPFQEEPCPVSPDILLRRDVECQTDPRSGYSLQTDMGSGYSLRQRFKSGDMDHIGEKTILVRSPRSYSPEVHHFTQQLHERWPLLDMDSENDHEKGGAIVEEVRRKNSSDSDISFLEDMQALEAAVHSTRGRMDSLSPNHFTYPPHQPDQTSLLPKSATRVSTHSPHSVPESPVQGPHPSAASLTSLSTPRASKFPPCTLSGFSSQDSVSGEGTFHSLLSLTGSLTSARTPEELSVFSLSPLDSEEKRMLDFQQYLQTRGVKLDMSSVQSSDL